MHNLRAVINGVSIMDTYPAGNRRWQQKHENMLRKLEGLNIDLLRKLKLEANPGASQIDNHVTGSSRHSHIHLKPNDTDDKKDRETTRHTQPHRSLEFQTGIVPQSDENLKDHAGTKPSNAPSQQSQETSSAAARDRASSDDKMNATGNAVNGMPCGKNRRATTQHFKPSQAGTTSQTYNNDVNSCLGTRPTVEPSQPSRASMATVQPQTNPGIENISEISRDNRMNVTNDGPRFNNATQLSGASRGGFRPARAHNNRRGRRPSRGYRGRGGRSRGSRPWGGFQYAPPPPTTHHDSLSLSDDSDDSQFGAFGFTRDEELELLCHGVKPWDPEAWNVLEVLHGHHDDYLY